MRETGAHSARSFPEVVRGEGTKRVRWARVEALGLSLYGTRVAVCILVSGGLETCMDMQHSEAGEDEPRRA